MGLRFRQSFQLFPGVRLNLSKGGISASFGVPGATLNVGPRGVKSTVGIPGTGLSYTHHHTGWGTKPEKEILAPPAPRGFPPGSPAPRCTYYLPEAFQMREISSASVEQLTSHGLVELRDMIAKARTQRREIEADLDEAKQLRAGQCEELRRRQQSFFRYFYRRRIVELQEEIPRTSAEIERLEGWLDSTRISMQFETSPTAKQAYGVLVRAFDNLRKSAVIWDITSDRLNNRAIERTAASRTLTRTRVSLDYASSDLIQFESRAMRFENANGEAILIYPGVIIMPRSDGAFALIDLREVRADCESVRFIEDESVPRDSQVVGHTWAKVNKDGSPDRRFRENYQIPVCLYGRVTFTSPGGVQEEYQFSNAGAAHEFGRAFEAYKAALSA